MSVPPKTSVDHTHTGIYHQQHSQISHGTSHGCASCLQRARQGCNLMRGFGRTVSKY
jgi:hypothetical protein